MKARAHPGKIFREFMKTDCVPLVGAYNGLVARQLATKGFRGCYTSGAAVSGSTAQPDIGMINYNGFSKVIDEIYIASRLPIIADADTGFGEGEVVAKTVWEYNKAGAAGLHVED